MSESGYMFPSSPGIELVGMEVPGKTLGIREKLQSLCHNVKESTLDIAELLEEAKRTNLYEGWGFESIIDYGEKELGFKSSKIRYLIKIVEVCRLLGIPRSEYGPVDISKLREITSLNPYEMYYEPSTGSNIPLSIYIKSLMSEAPRLSGEQIEYEVLKLKGMDGPDRPVVRSFSVSQETWDKVIAPALELARRKLGSAGKDDEGKAKEYSDGVCYEMLAAEFLADPNNSSE